MNEIDVKKLIELLQKAMRGGSERSEASQQKTVTERSEAPLKADIEGQKTFNDLLEEGKKKYTDINEKIKIAEENRKDLIDDEQIILELQEEQIEQLKNQFQINQKNLLNLIEQLKVGKEKGTLSKKEAEDLDEKIRILKEITRLQGADLEKDKKQKELKEGILSIAKQTWEISKQYGSELEKHIISISKANGGYATLSSNLRQAGRLSQAVTLGSGITGPENMRALEALSESFIGLTAYSEQAISSMQVTTAELTKVGVSSAMSAKGMDSLVTAMGKTPEQARKIQESFVNMAAKNRLALSAVSQAFAENSSRFVGYGEQMEKVLAGLAEQSLKTGVSISGLVKITQQFDTFEGAARAVGNLNAILGGDYLNSIELLTASDDERIKILKDGVAASGMQWSSMNRFQQMAVANAAGISDLNEASKIFGQTSLQNTRQQEDAAKVQKTLAEQAASVSLGMDKLKSTLNGLFIALDPLIEGFRMIVDFLTLIPRKIAAAGSPILSAITSIIILIGTLYLKKLLLGAGWNFVAGAIARTTAQLTAWTAASRAASVAGKAPIMNKFTHGPSELAGKGASAAPLGAAPVSSATSGLLANAGNMLKAAGSILVFAAALYVLALALQEFSSNKINKEGVGLAGLSIAALLVVFKAMDRATGTIGKGALAIGIMAIALIALGVGLSYFKGLDWKILASIGAIVLGLGLAMAGFGMAVSGPQSILVGIGIAMIVAIAGALLILGSSLEKISASFKTLSELKNIGELSSNLIKFIDDLADTSISPINNLANAIGLLAENLQKLASVSANMSLNVTGSARTVVQETVSAAAAAANDASAAANSAATRSQTLIPAQQTTAFVPVIVQIDKKTIVQILQKDIESIAKGVTLDTISAVGIVQSNSNIQDVLSGYSPAP